MKSFLKILAVVLIIAVVVLGILTLVLWRTEYNPNPRETLSHNEKGSRGLYTGREITIAEWNIGNAISSRENDSYKDGGKMVESNGATQVYENLFGISKTLSSYKADVYILDEVDTASRRTMNIDENAYIEEKLGLPSLFAYDKKVAYTPYPWPMEGNTKSGNAILSHFGLKSAERVALPYKHTSFPLKFIGSKNAAIVARIPLSDSTKQLVIISANIDKEPIKRDEKADAQISALLEEAYKEYNNGENYVIVAASFSRLLNNKGTINAEHIYIPFAFDEKLQDGWSLVYDESTPTARSLNVPYTGANRNKVNTYVQDGYIVSPNVKVNSVETKNEEFFYSAHNPVILKAELN